MDQSASRPEEHRVPLPSFLFEDHAMMHLREPTTEDVLLPIETPLPPTPLIMGALVGSL
jgi:hypothetical protein